MDDETFFAWLDGELDPQEADRVAALVDADPRLTQLAQQHRAMTAGLRGAFGTVEAAPVPESLAAAITAPRRNVLDFGAWRDKLRRPLATPGAQWAAMAATLALGIGLGTMVDQSGGSPVEVRGGTMYAAAALDRTLDRQLANAGAADGTRIGLTFRDAAGTICRSFTGPQASGLACRDGDDWQLRGLFAAPEGQSADYRMAAGADPNLGALIDSNLAGEPFDAAQEEQARRRGWR